MKRFLLVLGLLFCTIQVSGTYTVGSLDTGSTGGIGFNSSNGYILTDIGDSSDAGNGTAIQLDGKIVVVGSSNSNLVLARYTINGMLDTTFGTGGKISTNFGFISATGKAVTVLPNGKILVVGQAVQSGSTKFLIAQFLPNGTLDTTSFGSPNGYIVQNVTAGSTDIANALTVDSYGYIYVTGTSTQSGLGSIFVAKYNSSGVLQTSYNSSHSTIGGGAGLTIAGITLISITSKSLVGNALAFDLSGRIVVAGGQDSDYALVARLTTSGTADTTFDTDGIVTTTLGGATALAAYAVGFQLDGKIILAGAANNNVAVARFLTNGTLDTSFGISSSGYNRTTASGGGYAMVIQPDDKIIVAGKDTSSPTNFIIMRYLADGSTLDTTFNSPYGYNNTLLASSADVGNALAVQQNGSFVVAGTNSGMDFITARYLGDASVQGAMDLSYNPQLNSVNAPGYAVYPTTNTPQDKPQVVAIYPKSVTSSGSLYVVTYNPGSVFGLNQIVQLDATGNTGGSRSNIAIPASSTDTLQVQDVIEDSLGRAVVVGRNITQAHGFILRYSNNAGLRQDTSFTMGDVSSTSQFRRVAEQKAGRLVVIGQANAPSAGLLAAYNESGALATSSQTECSAFGDGADGLTTLGLANFYDMLIDSNDKIYVTYSDFGSERPVGDSNICLARYLANGSALDTSFGASSSGIIDTGWLSGTYSAPVITFDTSGNIVIAAVDSSGNIVCQRYAPTATATAPTLTLAQSTTLLSSPVLTKLQCDTTNRLVLTGYDTNNFFVGRCAAGTFTLDASFAPYAACKGILKTNYNDNNPTDSTTPQRVVNTVAISTTGNILFGGYENITSNSTVAVVGQVVGDTTTPAKQVARYPGAAINGVLDTSFGTNGALDMQTLFGNGQIKACNVVNHGDSIILAVANGTDTYLGKTQAGYTYYTGKSLTGLKTPQAIVTGADGNYYVVGTTGANRGIVYQLPADFTGGTIANTGTSNLTAAYAVTQQASGRILVAGYDSVHTSGVIVAYQPTASGTSLVIDTSFNPQMSGVSQSAARNTIPGYWYTQVNSPITSISVGTQPNVADKIYYAYDDTDNTAVVARLLENGTALDGNFGSSGVTSSGIGSVSANTQIKMQLDAHGNIVLAANTGAINGIRALRYTVNGQVDVNLATIIANVSGQQLSNILCLSDATTLILASVPNVTATSASISLAQLNSSFTLNTNFNPVGSTPGVLSTNVPSSAYTPVMCDFYVIDVAPVSGILIGGDNSQTAASADPYFAKVVNQATVAKVSQVASALGIAGSLDTTFNPAGLNAGFMNLTTELVVDMPASSANALLQNSGGKYYIGGSDSVNSYLVMMSDDDVQNLGFGASGLVTIANKPNLRAMMFAQNGNLVVVGGTGLSDTQAGWVQIFAASDGTQFTAFAPTVTLDAHYAVAQQSNGRILVAGVYNPSTTDVGAIIAYDPLTGTVDRTFGNSGIFTATGYGVITSMIVDSSDNIYFIANNSVGFANIQKLNATGTQVTNGSGIINAVTNAASNHVAFDQNNNIVATAVEAGTNKVLLYCFNAGLAAFPTHFYATLPGVTTPRITSVMLDRQSGTAGKVIITGYDAATTPITPFVARFVADLSHLDADFNTNGVQTGYGFGSITGTSGACWNAAMINADGKITVAGYENISANNKAYLMRVYGDEFIGQYTTSVAAGAAGNLNPNFATAGILSLAAYGQARSAIPQVILPAPDGKQYVAFSDGTILRFTNGNILDTSFGTDGLATACPFGVSAMILDGNGQLVVVGTDPRGATAGWIVRYAAGNSGAYDTTFGADQNTPGLILYEGAKVQAVIEQSLGRYVIAGQLPLSGYGALIALTNTGEQDATFAVGSDLGTGVMQINVINNPIAMVADAYDRIICAYKTNSTVVTIVRFTSTGQLDTSFGVHGVIQSALSNVNDASQIKIAFNQSGDIVLAAHTSAPAIAVIAYKNSIGTTVAHAQYNITSVISNTPVLTSLICYTEPGSLNDKVLLGGYQLGNNALWVACITASGAAGASYGLDAVFGGGDGIMTFTPSLAATLIAQNLTSLALYGDGEISIVGTQTSSTSTVNNPFIARGYNTPYVTQVVSCLDAQSEGIVDTTLGAGVTPNYTDKGITFMFSNNGLSQTSKAVVVQDGNINNILVAGDGVGTTVTENAIYLNMFDVDGLLNTDYVQQSGGSTVNPGQALILSMFPEQGVNDMLTYTTASGVSKAILAGYAYNTNLHAYGSLVIQCNLTSDVFGLDTTFGGLNNNSLGVAFGDGKQLNTIGLQSTGRIIAGGLDQVNNGLILAYTPTGNLDTSFGQGGTYVQGTTGIYTSAIDSQDRVVIAYTNGTGPGATVNIARMLADGSALDTTFGTSGIVTTGITNAISNTNLRLALDPAGNIVVAAVTTDGAAGTYFKVARYASSNGTLQGTIATLGGVSSMGLHSLTITRLLVDQNGSVILVGYDDTTNDTVVVARLLYTSGAYALDSTFNSTGTPGYVQYEVAGHAHQLACGACIHPDGRIFVGGAQY